jgi:hypothetical protein
LTLDIPLLYVKDKQAYKKGEGTLRSIGNPSQIARKLSESGAKLIHIVDLDALRGSSSNMDIYDGLTFYVNIEVESSEDEKLVGKLLAVKSRVVLELPAKTQLSKWVKSERLLVGTVGPKYKGNAEGVHDVIIEGANDMIVERLVGLGKRVIVHEADYGKLKTKNQKLVWGVLRPI